MTRLNRALEELRRLGLTPYKAWLCVEHFQCPENVDPLEVFKALEDYLKALAEQGVDPEEEWWHRYLEETRAREKRVPVPA